MQVLRRFFPVVLLTVLCICSGCKIKGMGGAAPAPVVPVPVEVKTSSAPVTEEKKNVIVCTADLMRAAEYFRYLHREYEGVASIIIRTPSSNGTAESDSRTSAAIMESLGKLNKDGSLMSVLILGNSTDVPRAVFFTGNGTVRHVSDYAYGGVSSAPENVLPVGRIPARSAEEAEAVAAKFERWYKDRAFRPAWPVSFVGGNGFGSKGLSDPELLFFNLQQEGMAGPEAIRYLGSAGGCEPERLRQSLAEDDVSVQWLAVDAEQDGFRAGNGSMAVSEIMGLDYKPGLPVVLIPSGGPDLSIFTGLSPAQAIVLSPGAGLAAMTGSSDASGINVELDEGRVTRVDSSGTARLLMEFHKAYFGGRHRIGEALSEARAQFVENAGKDADSSPMINLLFYGDPVMSLPLPVRTESPAYTGLSPVTKPATKNGVAVFPVNATISFAMEEGGVYPAVKLHVIDRSTGKTVSAMKVGEDDIFNFSADGEGSYLIYSRPLDGPLAWQFFDVRRNPSKKGAVAEKSGVKGRKDPRITAGLKPVLYTVQVSSNRRQESADKLISRLNGQGYDAYVVEVAEAGRRKWYCVRFGRFDSWSAAVEASAAYERKEQADAKIVRCNGGS
ncbi:C25 family cysteine peptidase [Maridesulfovibrio sp.]|uniref:C25 family cysteine peptidase n=1 Tax=Maridesulfovibrio sp. TaxID=2795000 RepID=UPI002A18CCAA|nr:C25 family cysteine peptidase [Maridesulfovibrio sp.]